MRALCTIKRVAVLAAALSAATHVNAQRFEAEDYNAFSDTTPGNTGGAYRQQDVDIEATSDAGGGYNVGWVDTGEWLTYPNLTISNAGTYNIRARVASTTGGSLSLDLNGGSVILGELAVPNTGGWQSWQTVETEVSLEAGNYTLGVYAASGGWNFNWIEVTPTGVNPPASSTTFEAEDYTSASDTTAGNTGGAYRSDDVDIEATTDTGGGYNIGWVDAGEWLSYPSFDVTNGADYDIEVRVASGSGGTLSLDLNGGTVTLGEINIPNTGGWQNWQTVTTNAFLPAGTHNLGVYASTGGWNLNWIKLTPAGSTPNPNPNPTVTWSDEFDTIDTNVWNFETGGGGWGNNELQYYTAGNNASIQYDAQAGSNVLVIEARQEQGGQCWWGGNCGYTSTRMNTRNKHSFKYGRMEARIKLPKAQGIWPAFWMLGDNFNTQGWPQGGELDIMEHVGTNNITSGALHGPGYSGNTPITGHLDHAAPIEQNYNVYAVEWDANGIRWYVNDINFYSVSRNQVEQYGQWVYDQPFWFLLNVAVGGNWPGDPNHASFSTQRMYIDYVRVYQ
ncbi:carbohydrate-binding protein [Gilvimarinus sp. SDUM040013]|uniref:Carbohydrate-binding protein n=1 Tax=Gilvimarinus gilvus TaxID=3058038 RepID=A0ABU4RY18_9GAMM|nr:carbohydrate-binding protein [Gilvimarinus sp. SDUM040013]MDO3386233.1 carbohydrate-binding protein [Gilvimarinus sp. SDUM040013]MDX6849772.1 carbohydrate-binding protein [Gilvimarinus sp. SDUM040013]